jgi:hypothetical protein
MSQPIPEGFLSIFEWTIEYLYQHPKDEHSTQTLRDALNTAANGVHDFPSIHSEIEDAYEYGLLRGTRSADENGVVFFEKIRLTTKGEKRAIQLAKTRKDREQASKFHALLTETADKKRSKDRAEDSKPSDGAQDH